MARPAAIVAGEHAGMRAEASSASVGIIDVVAIAAIVWVTAATLHEGLGHGVACVALGGDPVVWSTFHFDCARDTLTAAGWRIVSAAGTVVNLCLLALGWLWWRRSSDALSRLTAWTVVVVNGLTSFGYLVFSAAFGIGDWNRAGVLSGVPNASALSAVLAAIGVAGYYGIVRLGAGMLSHMPSVAASRAEARRLCITVWATTGAVSLLAAIAAGGGWRATLGAAVGVALGGNAGLLSIPRFVAPTEAASARMATGTRSMRLAAIALVAAFVLVLGPGLQL